MDREKLVEAVARAIGEVAGFPFDDAFEHKAAWVRAHGEKGGRFHDINEPFQSEFLEYAQAALEAIEQAGFRIVPVEPTASANSCGGIIAPSSAP